MMKLRSKKAFTLVEIMIVVAIIGLLAAIAIPNFIKARTQARKNICISNLRTIYHAMEEYMIDMNAATGVSLIVSATGAAGVSLIGSDNYIKDVPKCPYDNAGYGPVTTGSKPECPNQSGSGHVLP